MTSSVKNGYIATYVLTIVYEAGEIVDLPSFFGLWLPHRNFDTHIGKDHEMEKEHSWNDPCSTSRYSMERW